MNNATQKIALELITAIKEASDPASIQAAGEEHRRQLALSSEEQAKREEYIALKKDSEEALTKLKQEQESVRAIQATELDTHLNKISAANLELKQINDKIFNTAKEHNDKVAQLARDEHAHGIKAQELYDKESEMFDREKALDTREAELNTKADFIKDGIEAHNIREEKLTQREETLKGLVANLQS